MPRLKIYENSQWYLTGYGDPGPQGESGYSGVSGYSGESGYSGDSTSGYSGYSGLGSNVRTFSWVISNPAVGGFPGPRLYQAHTAVRIDSYVTAATSATFNIEERSTIGSAGTNLLGSDQVATVTGASTTSFSDSSLAADNWLWIDISAVSGTPGQVVITLTCTV